MRCSLTFHFSPTFATWISLLLVVGLVCSPNTATMAKPAKSIHPPIVKHHLNKKPMAKATPVAKKTIDDTLVVGVIAESALTPRNVTVGSEFQGTLVTTNAGGSPIGTTVAGLPDGTQFIGHVSKAENSHLSQETRTTQVTKVTIQVDKLIFPDGKVLPFVDPVPTRAHSELKLSWADQHTPKMVQANQPPNTSLACQRMPKGALYPGDLVYFRLNRAALTQTLNDTPSSTRTTP